MNEKQKYDLKKIQKMTLKIKNVTKCKIKVSFKWICRYIIQIVYSESYDTKSA